MDVLVISADHPGKEDAGELAGLAEKWRRERA
jgi:hypothetical protein